MNTSESVKTHEARAATIFELGKVKTWMSEDPDNLIFKRFDDLSVRNLLFLQQGLFEVNRDIENIRAYPLGEKVPEYETLMLRAQSLIASYFRCFYVHDQILELTVGATTDSDDAFFAYQRMKCLPPTPEHLLRVLHGSDDAHCRYSKYGGFDDLVSVVVTEKGIFHRYLRSKDWLGRLLATRQKSASEPSLESASPGPAPPPKSTLYFSETTLWLLDLLAVNCLAVALVGAPIVALTYIPSVIGRVFAVLVAVVVAAPLTSLVAANYATYGNMPMMLAYAAILATFLNQGPGSKSST